MCIAKTFYLYSPSFIIFISSHSLCKGLYGLALYGQLFDLSMPYTYLFFLLLHDRSSPSINLPSMRDADRVSCSSYPAQYYLLVKRRILKKSETLMTTLMVERRMDGSGPDHLPCFE